MTVKTLYMILQAAAYGLPVVATKNGGPVDIIKVNINPAWKHYI